MNTAKQTAKTAQDLAHNIAKQIANEPSEILKEAAGQVVGDGVQIPDIQTGTKLQEENQEYHESQDKIKSQRVFGALQKEIEDIRRGDVFKDLQARISQGVDVPIDNYTELSMEQKQVLKAQAEAFRNQSRKNEEAGLTEVPTIHSKPSRRFGAGQKQEAEKERTRIEKPIPPSG